MNLDSRSTPLNVNSLLGVLLIMPVVHLFLTTIYWWVKHNVSTLICLKDIEISNERMNGEFDSQSNADFNIFKLHPLYLSDLHVFVPIKQLWNILPGYQLSKQRVLINSCFLSVCLQHPADSDCDVGVAE